MTSIQRGILDTVLMEVQYRWFQRGMVPILSIRLWCSRSHAILPQWLFLSTRRCQRWNLLSDDCSLLAHPAAATNHEDTLSTWWKLHWQHTCLGRIQCMRSNRREKRMSLGHMKLMICCLRRSNYLGYICQYRRLLSCTSLAELRCTQSICCWCY